MAVEIMKPEKQQTSMGRRLFAMAAPMAGQALGGPAGAMAGQVIGDKMAGATTGDAVAGAAQSAFGRKLDASKQNPQVAVQEGLNVLSQLPQDHALRKELAEPLLKSQMLGQSSKYGMYGGR